MYDPESTAEEMFFRDLTNANLLGDGSSREQPIMPPQEGAELTPSQWELVRLLAIDYRRALLVVSGTTLYEVVPLDSSGRQPTPTEIEQNIRRRAAPNN